MDNALKANEGLRVWVYKTFKSKIQPREPNNSEILQNYVPSQIRSPLFAL